MFLCGENPMIKERLKELEIKITELANYLQISRPTMYKFIECYDEGKKKEVNKGVKNLFDYIEDNPLIGKRNVINYILTKMSAVQDTDTSEVNAIVQKIKEYVSNNPSSEKTQFIETCLSQSQFDIVVHYLMEIVPLLKKKRLSDDEKKKLIPYQSIISIYTTVKKEDK